MKKYRITVNGKTFDVDVEETGVQKSSYILPSAPPTAAVAPVAISAASTPAVKPATAPTSSAPPMVPKSVVSSGGAMTMKSPLPGKILKVLATAGSSWKKGDTLLVIEAMKMENEILAPRDCTVGEVVVETNQTVKTGDVLLKLI